MAGRTGDGVTADSDSTRSRGVAWRAATRAGAVYALSVFAVGCAFGSVRVLWVAPRLGTLAAVILETPVMFAVSWATARWCTRRHAVPDDARSRAVMGAVAFLVLMLVEFCFAVWVFGESPARWVAILATAPGAIGLLAQVCFAAVPFAQAVRPPGGSATRGA